ncbi:MAG TPA: hypothetical protein VLH80_04420 [Nitrospiraceae bacterium]|nr:hypothetical protein [Nitrospiraceae bacterium]
MKCPKCGAVFTPKKKYRDHPYSHRARIGMMSVIEIFRQSSDSR